MRTFIALALLSASVAIAQPVSGSWGGYVSGWTPDRQQTGGFDNRYRRPPVLTPAQQQYLAVQQLNAQQAYNEFYARQNYVQSQAAAARQQEQAAQQFAQQQEISARRAREEELAHQEQLLVQQQQLALQQQMLAQQQQQAAAEERARIADREEKLKAVEAEQKAVAERDAAREALARAEADAKPREKGPDIHRWVDEDGVVHYSTRPPKK